MTSTTAPAPVHDQVRRRLHQSTVNLVDVCAKRIEFKLMFPDRYSTSVLRGIGTGYHAAQAHWYWRQKQGDPVPDLGELLYVSHEAFKTELDAADDSPDFWVFQAETSRKPRIVLDQPGAFEALDELVIRAHDTKIYWPKDRFQVLDVEQHFVIPMASAVDPITGEVVEPPPGWEVAGTSDLGLQDMETGWVHVVDHKTAKTKWRKGKAGAYQSIQGAFYTDAYRRMFETPNVTFSYDVIDMAGGFERIPAHRTEAQVNLARLKTIEVARLMEQGGPYPANPSSFLCSESWCDYWNDCPYGRTLHE